MVRIAASSSGGKTNRSVRARLYWRAMRWLAVFAAMILGAGIILNCPSAPSSPRALNAQARLNLQPPDPSGTIDGAKNPELIPDDLAYKMLFLSLVEPENPTDAQKARQAAKLRMMNLSPIDQTALLELLGEFRDQMNAWNAQVAQQLKVTPFLLPGSRDWSKFTDLKNQQDGLVAVTAASLRSRLSIDGGDKLQIHLGKVKRGIKSIPTGMASN